MRGPEPGHHTERGCDAGDDLPVDVGVRALRFNLLDVLGGDLDLFELHLFELRGVDIEQDVEQGRPRSRLALLAAPEDPVQDHPHPGVDLPREIVLRERAEPLRLLPAAEPLGRLLDLDLLRVRVPRRLPEKLELRRVRSPLAPALVLVAFHGLAERLPFLGFLDDGPAAETLEQRVDDHRADLRGLPHEPLDRDEPPEVLRPQVPDLDAGVPRDPRDPEVDLHRFLRGGDDPPDRLLPRREDVQGLSEEVDRHVRVEPVQVLEADLEGPPLRVPVREPDDLGLQAELGEELLPPCDELLQRVLRERAAPPFVPPGGRPAREGRLVRDHRLLIQPPRRFASSGFLWRGERISTGGSPVTRIWSTRTPRTRCMRPDGRASRRNPGSVLAGSPPRGPPGRESGRRTRRSSRYAASPAFKWAAGGDG